MNTNIQTAIEVLKQRIRSKEEDVVRLKRTVNEMCADAGQEPPYAISSVEGIGDISSLRSDQFYGETISAAAKSYLEMRKSAGLGAASVNEIYAALRTGGFKFEAKDDVNAKNGLRISLRKNSSLFHRLPGGNYGLLSWYPNAKPPKDDEDEEGVASSTNGSAPGKDPADAFFSALKAAGRPLSRGELLKSAASKGVQIDKSAASQILHRDNRFSGVGHGRGAKWELNK
jgi:hypothetical protein